MYRCYVLYGRSWKVVLPIIALWIGGLGKLDFHSVTSHGIDFSIFLVSEAFSVYTEFTLHRSTNLNADRLTPWITSTLITTLALNLLATSKTAVMQCVISDNSI